MSNSLFLAVCRQVSPRRARVEGPRHTATQFCATLAARLRLAVPTHPYSAHSVCGIQSYDFLSQNPPFAAPQVRKTRGVCAPQRKGSHWEPSRVTCAPKVDRWELSRVTCASKVDRRLGYYNPNCSKTHILLVKQAKHYLAKVIKISSGAPRRSQKQLYLIHLRCRCFPSLKI